MPQCVTVVPSSFENAKTDSRPYLWICGVLSLYAAIFLIYSETWAFTWDESYHLLAAQLIDAGKRPYIDFCFPQTPLNAYWNAFSMRMLGQSWRVPHAFAALFTIGAVLLTADYVFHYFPVRSWRLTAAITAGLTTGLNATVFEFGSVAQPYGMCLFTLAVAFRISVRAVDRSGPLLAGLAGFSAGVAAASSLLSAAAAPVLLVWMLFYNRVGSRWTKLIAFIIGTAVPFAPVYWLFWLGPRQTWFNLVQYHLFFRKLYWPETTAHDLEVLTSWIDSGQALVLGLLAVFGLLYVARRSPWPQSLKAEFYLCAWLAAALTAAIGRAHPTFARYFLLTVPFLSILSVAGLYAIASRVLAPERPLWPVVLVSLLMALGLGKSLYERPHDTWSVYQRLANKVDQVTPRNALLFAEEPIYFLTKRMPPPGFELSYTHKVNLPPGEEALMHIITAAEVKRKVQSGMFATAYNCDDDEIQDYGLKKLYQQHVDMDDCTIFWDLKK